MDVHTIQNYNFAHQSSWSIFDERCSTKSCETTTQEKFSTTQLRVSSIMGTALSGEMRAFWSGT